MLRRDTMRSLIGLTTAQLEELVEVAGRERYRGRQIAHWLYRKAAGTWDDMTDVPAYPRHELASEWTPRIVEILRRSMATDGTAKYLLGLEDGQRIECVFLPYRERVSVCLSTQVGCAAGCRFCATALGGFARNLASGEIVEQVLTMQGEHPDRRISHVVYMGMGEPLLNYEAVTASVRLLVSEVGLSARHITISTVGVVPGILRLADEGLPVTLALSLHAPNDELRQQLIPTARRWSMSEILDACRLYRAKTGRDLTFEYILLAGVNDRPDQARALAARLRGLPGNVNLIPFNSVELEGGYRRPDDQRIAEFQAALERAGRVTTCRMERGATIDAACGQLRRLSGECPGAESVGA